MLNSIIGILNEFALFIKSPSEKEIDNNAKWLLIKTFFILFALDILIMSLLTTLIESFNVFGWVKIENHQLSILLDILPIWIVLILTVIILPLIEELVFRLPLRAKSNYFLRLIMIIMKKFNIGNPNILLEIWNKKYPFFFYSLTFIFSLIHIFNYDLATTMILMIPILILPQFVLSLFIGYLRVRFNFISGFLLHAIHNLLFISIALISIPSPSNKLIVDNHLYFLNIEEVERSNTSSLDLTVDSIRFNAINLKTIISTLTHKDEYLLEFEENSILKKHISLILRNKSNHILNKDSIVLNYLSSIYNFNLDSVKIPQKIYNLIVYDSLKLSKYSDYTKKGESRYTSSETLMTFENVTLEVIANELSRNYKLYFELVGYNHYFLNMELPNNDLKKLENILKAKYGIKLEQSQKEIDIIRVKFNK